MKDKKAQKLILAVAHLTDLELLGRLAAVIDRRRKIVAGREHQKRVDAYWAEFVTTYQPGDLLFSHSGGISLGPVPQSGDCGRLVEIKTRGKHGRRAVLEFQFGYYWFGAAALYRDQFSAELPTRAMSDDMRRKMALVGDALNQAAARARAGDDKG